jgi:cytochrome c-type biogenesis protein CcmE
VVLLAIAGAREGWIRYLSVDEFNGSEESRAVRVRLVGVVAEQNIHIEPAGLQASFDLCGDSTSVRVAYEGVIPDLFTPGQEVVVEGRLNDEGVFEADTLLTKCASKYEMNDGEAPHANPRLGESDA